MYLIYVDDSGDPGPIRRGAGSPTKAFVLSSLIINDAHWLTALDAMLAFRRFLKDQFGIRVRDELKAGHLIHGTGPCDGLSERARMNIYRMALRFQERIGVVRTWAVAINKGALEAKAPATSEQIRELAWRYTIQRFERFTNYGQDRCIVFPDEGHPEFVRRKFREMRRYSTVPSAINDGERSPRPATMLVEDPNFRKSHESYFTQFADLNAYAAYRSVFPESWFNESYWERLETARVSDVAGVRPRAATGIVFWPPNP